MKMETLHTKLVDYSKNTIEKDVHNNTNKYRKHPTHKKLVIRKYNSVFQGSRKTKHS